MFWLIENTDQLKGFYNKGYKEAYVEVIPYSYKTHPVTNKISLVYVHPLDAHKGYIISINHSESMPLNSEYITELISSYDTLYVWGKKEFLHYYVHKNIIDISSLRGRVGIDFKGININSGPSPCSFPVIILPSGIV